MKEIWMGEVSVSIILWRESITCMWRVRTFPRERYLRWGKYWESWQLRVFHAVRIKAVPEICVTSSQPWFEASVKHILQFRLYSTLIFLMIHRCIFSFGLGILSWSIFTLYGLFLYRGRVWGMKNKVSVHRTGCLWMYIIVHGIT